MARKPSNDADARAQLWKELDDTRVCMLWVPGSGQHPQPMTHFPDPETGCIWFITSSDTDLASAVGSSAPGQLVIMSKDMDFQASVSGRLTFNRDQAKLNELWSKPMDAWFSDGAEDETARLLCLAPEEAAIWASDSNGVLVGLKLLRASMKGDAPQIGVHHVVRLEDVA